MRYKPPFSVVITYNAFGEVVRRDRSVEYGTRHCRGMKSPSFFCASPLPSPLPVIVGGRFLPPPSLYNLPPVVKLSVESLSPPLSSPSPLQTSKQLKIPKHPDPKPHIPASLLTKSGCKTLYISIIFCLISVPQTENSYPLSSN